MSKSSSGCVAGVEGYEIQGEETGELPSETCLESILSKGLTKVENECERDCGSECGDYRGFGKAHMCSHILLLASFGFVCIRTFKVSFKLRVLSWLQRMRWTCAQLITPLQALSSA